MRHVLTWERARRMKSTIILIVEWAFIVVFLRTAEITMLNWQLWAIWLVVCVAYLINYLFDDTRNS